MRIDSAIQYLLLGRRRVGSFRRCIRRLRSFSCAERDCQLVPARKLFEMPESEMFEEHWRRSVQQRSAKTFPATRDVDQSALVQRLEHAADGHSPYFFDLDSADRLSIGNDRQRF